METIGFKKILFIVLVVFSGTATVFPGNKNLDYTSPEYQYQHLAKEMDFWINSPIIMNDQILFFFKEKAQRVLVAGDFNGWKPELLMTPKATNLIQFIWEERLKKGIYKYKLIVDDIWVNDPYNTNYTLDESGQKVSFFELKEDFIPHAKYPLWTEKDFYLFRYENIKAKSVYLAGDFNNWNPYSLPLEDKGNGEFFIKIRLSPGVHAYCFVIDGEWKADPDNLHQYSDKTGSIVSAVYVKENEKQASH